MKKIISSIVTTLVTVSFASIVFAAEPVKETSPAMPAGHPPVAQKAEPSATPAKKAKKARKAKKAVKPAETPAAPAAPATAAPAAK